MIWQSPDLKATVMGRIFKVSGDLQIKEIFIFDLRDKVGKNHFWMGS